MPAFRVLVIHRYRLLGESLAFSLEKQQDIAVIGVLTRESSGGSRELLKNIKKLNPDLVILDLCLPA